MKKQKDQIGGKFTGARAWFPKARFGMFIHFGLYALHGGNENDYARGLIPKKKYEKMMHRFNPKSFNADAWVKLAEDAGARYIVITSKHGEGFCLWDSRQTEYKITRTPFKRDLLKELGQACHRRGMRFGIYYSLCDWHYAEPGEGTPEGKTYPGYVEAQLRELLARYGRVDEIWFDGGDKRLTTAIMRENYDLIHRLQPSCVVNDRLGLRIHGDFTTPERRIPKTPGSNHMFIECCDAIGQKSWGYHRGDLFWSTPELIRRLTRVAALGGNYLLNVEPMPDGRIRPECTDRMLEIGRWLKANGETVYQIEACHLVPRDPSVMNLPVIGCSTRHDKTLYFHLFNWPLGQTVLVKNISGNVRNASILGSKARLSAAYTDDGLIISGLPARPPVLEPVVIKVLMSKFVVHPGTAGMESKEAVKLRPQETVYLRPDTVELRSETGVPMVDVYTRFPDVQCICCLHFNEEIAWHLLAEKAGSYDVYADLGAADSQQDTVFGVEIARQAIKGKSVFTGGCDQPQRLKVGQVKIPAGQHELSLKILEIRRGSAPDIYNVILQPK